MVYYRKYRPQTISELDLGSVRVRLTSILSAKELPHAFLFTGPKGLGKTSSARILAKAINCEKRTDKNIEPCNSCEACTSITRGSNLDVIEIDAASNRGIDEIRDLREKIKYAPSTLRKKVYIIDEVHMLTTDAFNALLKTLEEPPDHAVFILCTTELEKVPATIISRAFHVQFVKPSKDEIVNSLNRIVKGEKLNVDPKVLDEVYKLSEGAFRDAAKILEDLSFSAEGGKITLETLEKNYKTGSIDAEIKKLLDSLSKKDLKESLSIIEELSKKGSDFKIVTENLASILHNILMGRAGLTRDVFDIKDLAVSDVKKLLNLVNESYKNIKVSILPQLPLELVVAEFCIESIKTEPPVINVQKAVIEQVKEEVKVEVQVEKPAPAVEAKIENTPIPQITVTEEVEVVGSEDHHGELFKASSKPESFYALFLSKVKSDNHSLAGILRGCRLVTIEGGSVQFETRFKFHRDKLTEGKTSSLLDMRASEILAEKVHVVVNLVEK